MLKRIIKLLAYLSGTYVLLCLLLFVFQEKLIFFPEKLDTNYHYPFNTNYEELTFKTKDGTSLNGLLFKCEKPKGLIFYLHGNGGSLRSWGELAPTYTQLNYDVFMLDYRGYGKSEGCISNEEQFFDDVQTAYSSLKTKYSENKTVVLGYSIGTGAAAQIAATNHPKLLILQAPYFSLVDLMQHTYPIIPTLILKYKFNTFQSIQNCKMPIVIFHGTNDEVIYYESSLKL
ncbi:MAG: alpha/beta fold hydrolase, partial [Bacteroidia bacterium]|nr:alpha/beta fold hydrolase [Bacteroidia bacterium]